MPGGPECKAHGTTSAHVAPSKAAPVGSPVCGECEGALSFNSSFVTISISVLDSGPASGVRQGSELPTPLPKYGEGRSTPGIGRKG